MVQRQGKDKKNKTQNESVDSKQKKLEKEHIISPVSQDKTA